MQIIFMNFLFFLKLLEYRHQLYKEVIIMSKNRKIFTIRRNNEWDEMLTYLSQKLMLDKSSTVRLALVQLYNEYQKK